MAFVQPGSRSIRVADFLEKSGLARRESPKINGSVGGFIALIVFLVLIIIISCTGIFFLLRERNNSDEELAAHRHRYQHQSTTSNLYHRSSDPPATRAARLGRFFGFKGADDSALQDITRGKIGRGGRRGWVQAGSSDDWDSDSGDERRRTLQPIGLASVQELQRQGPPVAYPAAPNRLSRPTPSSHPTADSTSSVRFDLQGLRGLAYHDRNSPSPHPTLPNIHTRISSPTSSGSPSPVPMRTTSPESMSGSHSIHGTDRQVHSQLPPQPATSPRTFEGGSKFIEAL